jgi:hypothetical protein
MPTSAPIKPSTVAPGLRSRLFTFVLSGFAGEPDWARSGTVQEAPSRNATAKALVFAESHVWA